MGAVFSTQTSLCPVSMALVCNKWHRYSGLRKRPRKRHLQGFIIVRQVGGPKVIKRQWLLLRSRKRANMSIFTATYKTTP